MIVKGASGAQVYTQRVSMRLLQHQSSVRQTAWLNQQVCLHCMYVDKECSRLWTVVSLLTLQDRFTA